MTRLAEFYKLFPDSEGLLSNLFQGLFVLRFMVAFPQVGTMPDNGSSQVKDPCQKLVVAFLDSIDFFTKSSVQVEVVGKSGNSESINTVFKIIEAQFKHEEKMLKLMLPVGALDTLEECVHLSGA